MENKPFAIFSPTLQESQIRCVFIFKSFAYLGGRFDSVGVFLGSSRANSMASTALMWAMTGNSAVFCTEMENFSTM